MQTLEAIRTRRSIRAFTDEPVLDEQIRTILAAAMNAPSARNQQSWEFIVIDDRDILDEIPTHHASAKMCLMAPIAIAVCGNTLREQSPGFWQQDCAAATENMLLAAHDIGIGAVWCGIYPREDRVKAYRELLHLPDGIIPMALVVIGNPAECPHPEDRYNPDFIHRNKW